MKAYSLTYSNMPKSFNYDGDDIAYILYFARERTVVVPYGKIMQWQITRNSDGVVIAQTTGHHHD